MSCERAFDDDQAGRYVAAELSETDRDAFEEHFLECAPCRAAVEAHLDFVEALRARRTLPVVPAAPRAARPAPAFRALWPGLAAAAGLVFATLGWYGGRHVAGQRFETERAALEDSNRRLEQQLRAEKSRERDVPFTSFALAPGLERGESAPAPLTLAAGLGEVHFELDLQTVRAYPDFEAELRGPKGDLVWSQGRLRAEGPEEQRVLVARVPAAVMSDGEHEILLRGRTASGTVENAAVYSFRLRRR